MIVDTLRKLTRRLRGRGIEISDAAWEGEFSSGHWAFLGDLGELARYSIIAGYLAFLKPGGSILDIGCGEAILLRRLDPASFKSYVGVDISEAAIESVSSYEHDKAAFVTGSAATFVPTDSFSSIVFNEMLYYCDDPIQILRRYEGFLEEGGIFIVSMMTTIRTTIIWNKLKRRYRFVDETKIRRKRGGRWSCRVLMVPDAKSVAR